MSPSPLLLVLLLLLRLHPAPACDSSNSNLSCFYNFNRSIRCEWTTNRTDACSMQAHNVNPENLSQFIPFNSNRCALEATDRPRLRRCTLHFHKKVWILSTDMLSLNLSCVHGPGCLVPQYRPENPSNIKLDALDAPVVNGSRLSWKKANILKSLVTLQYQAQWTLQDRPWADGWDRVREENCTELQADSLVLGQKYRARVRVRVQVQDQDQDQVAVNVLSNWSDWSPALSWASAVGQEPRRGSEEAGLWLWPLFGVVFVLGLLLVSFWRSRVYKMTPLKGAPLSSPTPSVLKMGWQPPLFSSDSYLTFFKPVDIIASVELLPPEPRPPPDEDPCSPSGPLCSSLSSFSNPMYSQLCPHPQPDPDPDPDLDLAGLLGDPGLDLLLLLSTAHQSPGVPVVCEYERVEAVGAQQQGPGADRVRLTSVDSGVGSGEEVSQDSLHLEEHTVIGSSSVEDQPVVSTAPTP